MTLCIIVNLGCSDDGAYLTDSGLVYGSGTLANDTVKNLDYKRLHLWEHCDADISISDSGQIIISTDENLLRNYLNTILLDDMLLIKLGDGVVNVLPTYFQAMISVDNLIEVFAYKSKCVFKSDWISDADLLIRAIYGSVVARDVVSPQIELWAGQSRIELGGRIDGCKAIVNDGIAELLELECVNMDLKLLATDAKVNCTDTLKVFARSHSTLHYKGDPKAIIADVDSTSELIKL